MRILVLERADSWHVNDLRRAAATRHQIETAQYDQLQVRIGSTSGSPSPHSAFSAGAMEIENFNCIFTRALPSTSLEQAVFRMDWLDQVAAQNRLLVVNPAKTIEASVDKYLSLEKIRAAGINVPDTHVSQSVDQALEHFRQHGGDSVVKPVFGSRGRNIVRVQDERTARSLFESLADSGSVIYQQRYIEHGDSDLRLLVVGSKVFGMQRFRPGHWVTNISQGADGRCYEPSQNEKNIALRAANSVGAQIAGVDLVYDQMQQPILVEINACPSWKAISQVNSIDIAAEILLMIESILCSGHQ